VAKQRQRIMKRWAVGIAVLALIGFAVFLGLTSPLVWQWVHPAREVASEGAADLGNGKTLFIAGDCGTCHASAGQKDATKLGGGQALTTGFGTFYMPNISADPTNGIGDWTTAQFTTAMREGVSPHGDNEYPALPYTSYQRMSSNDLRDLLAYLKTLPPVTGKVRDHDLSFPFTMRRGVGLWRLAFLDGKPSVDDASKSAAWNRGHYLVEGPAHCAECHSPRNLAGSIVSAKRFSGGADPSGTSYTPNITADETGIGYWSRNEIASYLKDGVSPINIKAGGDMAAIIANTSRLSDDDRQAIATYVKSLPGVDSPNKGIPEPNRTSTIRMLPAADDQVAVSKLAAISAEPAEEIAKAATLYVVATKGLFVNAPANATTPEDGKLFGATKLAVVGRSGSLLQVRIDGWQQAGSDTAIYALRGQRIVQAVLGPKAVSTVRRSTAVHDAATNQDWFPASLTAWVRADGVNPDLGKVWAYTAGLYGDTCAACHALPSPDAYLTNQWTGTLAAMKRYASLDDAQYRLLLAYLQYHSKDVGVATVVAKQ
jgi:mono/diheme cytochrome c family protein